MSWIKKKKREKMTDMNQPIVHVNWNLEGQFVYIDRCYICSKFSDNTKCNACGRYICYDYSHYTGNHYDCDRRAYCIDCYNKGLANERPE